MKCLLLSILAHGGAQKGCCMGMQADHDDSLELGVAAKQWQALGIFAGYPIGQIRHVNYPARRLCLPMTV